MNRTNLFFSGLALVVTLILGACTKPMQVAASAGALGRGVTDSTGAISCSGASASYSASSSSGSAAPLISITFTSNVAGAVVSQIMAGTVKIADSLNTCKTSSGSQTGAIGAPSLTSAPSQISWTISAPSNPGVTTACAASVSTVSYPNFLVSIDSAGALSSGQLANFTGCTGAFFGSGQGPTLEGKVSQVGGEASFTYKINDSGSGARKVAYAFEPNDGTGPIFGTVDPTTLLRINHVYGPVGSYIPRLSVIDSKGMRSQIAIMVKNYIASTAPGSLPSPQPLIAEGSTFVYRSNVAGSFDLSGAVSPATISPKPPLDIAAAGDGNGNMMYIWHLPSKTRLMAIQVFGSTYVDGVRPFMGDLLGTGTLVVGGGAGSSVAKVKYFDARTGLALGENITYGSAESPYTYGVFPAVYRTPAGQSLLMVGQGSSASAAVRFFSGIDPTRGYTFSPFGANTYQARVSSGLNELATVLGGAVTPVVKVHTFDGNMAHEILSFSPSNFGASGSWVALSYPGDSANGGGNIAVGTPPNVSPTRVRMYSRTNQQVLWEVQPWGTEDCGARISTAVIGGVPVVVAAPGGPANNNDPLPVRVFNAITGAEFPAMQNYPLDLNHLNNGILISSIPFGN